MAGVSQAWRYRPAVVVKIRKRWSGSWWVDGEWRVEPGAAGIEVRVIKKSSRTWSEAADPDQPDGRPSTLQP